MMRGSRVAVALMVVSCALSACATKDEIRQRVEAMEPDAQQAARERAQTDLNCAKMATRIVDRQVGELDRLQGLHRVVYQVEVSGCGHKSLYSVACSHKGLCSAMSDSGLVERQK